MRKTASSSLDGRQAVLLGVYAGLPSLSNLPAVQVVAEEFECFGQCLRILSTFDIPPQCTFDQRPTLKDNTYIKCVSNSFASIGVADSHHSFLLPLPHPRRPLLLLLLRRRPTAHLPLSSLHNPSPSFPSSPVHSP